MNKYARTFGLTALSLFMGALTVTALTISGHSSHAASHGLIARSEAEQHRLGYHINPTPVPQLPSVAFAPGTPLTSKVAPHIEPLQQVNLAVALPRSGGQYVGHIPTALEVAMNPFRYVGAHVHWTCLVSQVPDPAFADANCGGFIPSFVAPPLTAEQMQNDPAAVARSVGIGEESLHRAVGQLGRRAMIVLTGAVEDLENNETIVIDGTVRPPLLGENAFGVTRRYPTVHIDTIDQTRHIRYKAQPFGG